MTPSSTGLVPQPANTAGPPPETHAGDGPPLWGLTPEDFPDLESIVIEDGKPVDGILAEKQMRLLTETLYSSWASPAGQPFVVMADVAVFHTYRKPPLVPDVLFALGVEQGQELNDKANLSYFVWLRGKVPDVAIEVVSNREGGEDTTKLAGYALIGVPYYVIFDPENLLGQGVLRVYLLQARTYQALKSPYYFAELELGVDLWNGRFEDVERTWLRWRDREGEWVPTGAERAEKERQHAAHAEERIKEEQQRADRLQEELERLKQQLSGSKS